MNEKKYILIIAALTIVIFAGGIMFISNSSAPQLATSQNAKAYVQDPTSFDWGEIAYSGKKATKTFAIKNTGTDILKLYNINTSCHCTRAYATIEGKDSPSFGMGGISSWVGEVPPGKEAKLTAVFDQAFHGEQGIGPITRYVSVETNDKGNQKLTFTLTGTVVK